MLDRGWRRIVSELGVEFLLPEAVELFRAAGQKVEGENLVKLDPEFVLEQVAKAPREFELAGAQPGAARATSAATTWSSPAVYGPPFVREGDVRRDATMADFENFVKLSQSFPELDSPGGTIVEPNDTPARLAPPRHGLRAPDAVRQAVHGLGDLGPERASTRSRWARSCSAARSRCSAPGLDLADQLQLAAALGRPDAERDGRVQPRQPGRRDDAVPAHGRDVAGLDPGHARAADRRGAVGDRALPARAARLPGRLRLVPVQHRHAVGLAQLRHARVGDRPALHRPDRAPLRAAVPQRRRADRVADAPTPRAPTRR